MDPVLEGYTDTKLLQRSERSEVHEAVREADGLAVVLKSYLADAAEDPRARISREFALLRRLDAPGIPRALALDRTTQRPRLVMSRLPGAPLAREIAGGPLPLELWLDLAVQLAALVAQLHAARILHKDLTPDNVLLDRKEVRASLCDFGLATQMGDAEHPDTSRHGTHEATLLYIAPEQTGRMNRGCDFRSDLYALGATLYHACTGRPPFESRDALELIHAHIARDPPPPTARRPELPETLSRLILKLLRKEPAERYQSASSLHADLLRCRQQWTTQGTISPDLPLGEVDSAACPRFAQKPYGRGIELERLLAMHADSVQGVARALWIRGEPGMGKSTLVDALRPHLVTTGAYLATGTFDQGHDRPYDGWVGALESLVHQLLMESDARLGGWRQRLREGLASIAGALVEVAPDLAFVLGEVSPVPPLPPRETQARLSLALQRFIRTCATPERPLVVFLDDLQWADAASRSLLEDALASDIGSLLVLGAFRSTEVVEGHPLAAMLERLAQRGAPTQVLELLPIGLDAVGDLLADALQRTPADVAPLAALIERKTGNNPLLVRQFVEHIHARGLLRHRSGEGWFWDHAAVAAADVPDGAAALMGARLDRLDAGPRELIQLASCAGDEFDTALLCQLSRHERGHIEQQLYALCDTGLIAPCPRGFRFVHGRIREAAQSQLSAHVRSRLHHDMARLLLERIPESERDAHVFLIVEHLNRGLEHVAEELRIGAVRLNVQAGRRALATGAASTSESYLGVARGLFREADWADEHDLGFELLLSSAESGLLRRDFPGVLALLDELERRSRSLRETMSVDLKRIQVRALTQNPEECMRHALEVLARLGVRWPLRPPRWRAVLALRRLQWRMWRRERSGAALLQPSATLDARRLATILVIGVAAGVMNRVSFYLAVLASSWVNSSNLRHGYLAHPAFTLSTYAGSLELVLGASRAAQRVAQLALEWSDRVPDPAYRPRAEMQVQALLRPWWMRRRQAMAPVDDIAERMNEVGDLEYAYYARFLTALYGALAGQPVTRCEQSLLQLSESIQRRGHSYPQPERCHRVYRWLAREAPALEAELAESDAWIAATGGSAEPYVRTLWMLVLCVHGRHDLAFAQSEKLGHRLFEIVPYVHVADHTFYRGLSAARLAGATRGRKRRAYVRELAVCVRRLRRWAKNGPDFLHMTTFLEAERAQLRGRRDAARRLYRQAALTAQQQDYVHHAALAHEQHARSLLLERRETEATTLLTEAIQLYLDWGARPKAAALKEERRTLIGEVGSARDDRR
jgi:histidine kinase